MASSAARVWAHLCVFFVLKWLINVIVRFPYSVQYYLSSQWAVPIVEVSTFISVGEVSGFVAVFVAPMLENFGAPVLHSIVGCAAAAGVLIVLSAASPNL